MTKPVPAPLTAYYYLRFAAALLYVVMALWLVAAGARRIWLQVIGTSPPDFAAYTSFTLGAAALLMAVVVLIVRRQRQLREIIDGQLP